MNHINGPSMGQPSTVIQDEMRATLPPLQQAQHPSQYPNGGNPAISAPAPAQRPTAGEVRHG